MRKTYRRRCLKRSCNESWNRKTLAIRSRMRRNNQSFKHRHQRQRRHHRQKRQDYLRTPRTNLTARINNPKNARGHWQPSPQLSILSRRTLVRNRATAQRAPATTRRDENQPRAAQIPARARPKERTRWSASSVREDDRRPQSRNRLSSNERRASGTKLNRQAWNKNQRAGDFDCENGNNHRNT